MKNKGFTLVELLAVIVVLGIIMTIAGMSLSGTKKDANQKEVESIYNTIKKLGPDVYLSEIAADNDENGIKVYSAGNLLNNGYLKSVVNNPAKSGDICGACLIIKTDKQDNMFDAYVECDGLGDVGDKLSGELYNECIKDKAGINEETNDESEDLINESENEEEDEEFISESDEEATE